MKFCMSYNKNSKRIKDIDELIIPFDKKLINDLSNLYPDKKLIIKPMILIKEDDISFLKDKSNYILSIGYSNYQENKDKIKENDIKFMFDNLVDNYEDLLYYKQLGVAEIRITNDLCFDIYNVYSLLKESNIKIRCIPNWCQTNRKELNLGIKTFFIRPEDLEKYWMVDTFELWGNTQDAVIADTIFSVYHDDKKWMGKLNEIIIDLDSEIDSRFIMPQFAERRVKCNRECLKGGRCQLCNRIEELSNTLKESGLMIRKKEDKDE